MFFMTTTDKTTALELPASVEDLITWAYKIKPGSVIEATVYNKFRRDAGKTKIQRLVIRHD